MQAQRMAQVVWNIISDIQNANKPHSCMAFGIISTARDDVDLRRSFVHVPYAGLLSRSLARLKSSDTV